MPFYTFRCDQEHTTEELRSMGDKSSCGCKECGRNAPYSFGDTVRISPEMAMGETEFSERERNEIYQQTGERFTRVKDFDAWAKANNQVVLRPADYGISKKNLERREKEHWADFRKRSEKIYLKHKLR